MAILSQQVHLQLSQVTNSTLIGSVSGLNDRFTSDTIQMEIVTQTRIILVTKKVSVNLLGHSQAMRYGSRKLVKAKMGKK